ncbi:MAG: carbonic anhydrase [Nitrospirae bacterium CG_4_10_14_0_8_um_filter_41_23]|nr:carbonic anhydrase [Nitrospirota bacterium]PIQ94808.1 MAG: carbonic anhydrase [Nitrospirae bacterium CG11_big_fil_rev_8_21_14_0_20_41_14]PIV42998.1 MAG: carbonic anhydrase [Nitrospirae bacterium CG02_land_8_20_14_3_00_41_53]PIW86978.1 MAG: carbonic anhydrase [Nitrospirae bacterium CG_4_8_14_3_um_filter_41_47]PIY87337.1 MAG: carbonic anhydrase [Nitrospirae bacterium CG_4_10_14_0_8_um_filter_41_23]PJA79571.1 MAG: carbonic anhydrase [Nitrospirae bacterium CG_4_9_14_3_um_filter_41_27]
MKQFRAVLALFVILVFSGVVFAGSAGDDALQKLMDGNKRYVSGSLVKKDLGDTKRKELAKGQKPFAIVVTCSDSRVPPELLFDQGLGDIFIIRVAGNVVDQIALGSIEYGAEHLNAPLLFILGHSKCGAVTATIDAKGEPEGNIGAIVKKIMPAAEKAKKKGGTKDEVLETAIKENVKNVYKDVMKSKIISHLVQEDELKIVAGEYNITTGKIEMIELPKAAAGKKGH